MSGRQNVVSTFQPEHSLRPELDSATVAAGLTAVTRWIVDVIDYYRNPGGSRNNRLIPLTEWPKYHPWPSVSALRALVAQSKTNGFDKVIRRRGRRILLDEAAFQDWSQGRR